MIADDDEELIRDKESMGNSSIAPLFPQLRHGIWHTTGPHGYVGIRKSGFILPNQGERPLTYPQSAQGYGYDKGYVCLFDLGAATDNECIFDYWKWTTFFTKHDPFTIAIELMRDQIVKRLIPNRRAREDAGYSRMWIPWVEAWHDGPIPISAVQRYFFIPNNRTTETLIVSPDDPAHEGFMREFEKIIDLPG